MAAENQAYNGDAVQATSAATSQSPQNAELAKEEVGWYFVERYYNTLSKNPEKLYMLYNKRSQFVAGVEEEKVQVSIGLKAIDDRVKELEYQDCKVRITNVDSQSSDINIVVQVIGEMTNAAKPHRKFCQTFVLAPQPHGYFLLNDILRFMADEEDEPLELQSEPASIAEADESIKEPAVEHSHTEEAESSKDNPTPLLAPVEPEIPSGDSIAAEDEEGDYAHASSPHVDVDKSKSTTHPSEQLSEEFAAPTPADEPHTAGLGSSNVGKDNPAPSKPALPLSWAQRIGAGNSTKPATAGVSVPTPTPAVNGTASKATVNVSSSVKAATPQTASAPAAPAAPARQPSPADSAQDDSQGGWQTAGTEHGKAKPRNHPPAADNGHVRAYVKNVFQSVSSDALKAELSKYGELAYFDVSRQKNSAFVEFSSIEAFKACIAANPHKIGDDSIIVEERRPAPAFANRLPHRGGRGGSFDGRQGPGRGGFAGKDGNSARGGINGARGGRGAPGSVANRGRSQIPQ